MNFLEAKKIMDEKLGDWKIMALASCVDNYPMVRNVSCVFYNDKIYFKNLFILRALPFFLAGMWLRKNYDTVKAWTISEKS